MTELATDKQVEAVRSDLKRFHEDKDAEVSGVRRGESPKWVNRVMVLGLFISAASFVLLILKHWLGW